MNKPEDSFKSFIRHHFHTTSKNTFSLIWNDALLYGPSPVTWEETLEAQIKIFLNKMKKNLRAIKNWT